jgi:signal transduction histidine kinase
VRLAARRDHDQIEVEVADTGAGIALEHRARIWEPFVTGRANGTGLGLAIVHSVVERHGGSIELDCPSTGGTRMIVRLPVAIATPADTRPESAA